MCPACATEESVRNGTVWGIIWKWLVLNGEFGIVWDWGLERKNPPLGRVKYLM
jgi:hypothetical protein